MAFTFVRTTDGSAPMTTYYLQSNVAIVKGDLLYFDATGHVSNTTAASAVTDNVAGVAEETRTGVSVGAGGTSIAVQVNRAAVYRVDTTAVSALTDVGTNVALDTPRVISESTAVTDRTGVVRIVKYLTASTSQSCEVMINFAIA